MTLQNPKNPALNLGRLAFVRFETRVEIPFETAICIRRLEPFGDNEGVLLVGRSPCARESPAPHRRIEARYCS